MWEFSRVGPQFFPELPSGQSKGKTRFRYRMCSVHEVKPLSLAWRPIAAQVQETPSQALPLTALPRTSRPARWRHPGSSPGTLALSWQSLCE